MDCDIREFGAVPDGVTLNTAAIQRALDACHTSGGGRVSVEGGRYLAGMIRIGSGVELRVEGGATLLASADEADFPPIESEAWHTEYAPRRNSRCFIYAENAENIAITGRGQIDCQGAKYLVKIENPEPGRRKFARRSADVPPRMVFFMGCRDARIEDITLYDPAGGWAFWLCGCDMVRVRAVTVDACLSFPNTDGIHINCCRDVTVSDCVLRCGDDAIVVRAYTSPLLEARPCERVAVTNCAITSSSCAVRVAWSGDGEIRDCVFSNLTVTDTRYGLCLRLPPWNPDPARRGSDMGENATLVERVLFDNIVLDRVYGTPIFVVLAEGSRAEAMREITFRGIRSHSRFAPQFSGLPNCPISDISLSEVVFTVDPQAYTADSPLLAPAAPLEKPFAYVENLSLDRVRFNIKSAAGKAYQ